MAITIDTHVLIWYVDKSLNDKLSKKALSTLEDFEGNSFIYVPVIVLMEL